MYLRGNRLHASAKRKQQVRPAQAHDLNSDFLLLLRINLTPIPRLVRWATASWDPGANF